ncbi:MOSC domain-containing protein [Halosimplex litoreum]|uniref:MOSC domain-containing protein n=1 Tax=Halosimplex litoreum TaxID=1198301 RepID=A0A7T3KWP6_9EURY|nr:MOSC domain-containing protein [Halosimplex litoreum]QPV64288.1 MOSC domain-containing protein [Halosimplex litoreum]
MNGTVERIHVVPASGADPEPVERVEAVAGAGLRGDRYFDDSPGSREGSDLTLVASEALAAVEREYGLSIEAGVHRRNVTVAGVDLDGLVDERFRVGDAVCVGSGPCEPCAYLADRLDEPDATAALAGRGGLRCRIVESGAIRVGDPVGRP